MRTLSEKQKSRLKEINERQEIINKFVIEKIEDPIQPLPLNLLLEARFNRLMKAGIELEGEIKYLEENGESMFSEGKIETKRRRLDSVKGQLNELQNIGDMIREYDALGRSFEVVPKI